MSNNKPKAKTRVQAWLATAKPGCCPCGENRRPRGVLCGNDDCEKTYQRLYGQDRRGENFLRVVEDIVPIDGRPRHRTVHFACKHTEVVGQAMAKLIGVRRRCPTCASGAPQDGTPPDASEARACK